MRNPNPTIMPPFGSYIDPDHPLAKGLVGCWIFNEHCGRLINDLSPYRNNGRILGGALWKDGLYFNGSNTKVDFGNDKSLNFGIGDFSVECCIEKAEFKQAVLTQKGKGGSWWEGHTDNNGWLVRLEENNNLTMTIQGGDDAHSVASIIGDIAPDFLQHHIAVAFDRDNAMTLYADGVTKGSSDSIATVGNVDNPNTYTVKLSNSKYFHGLINKTSLYSKVMSLDEAEWLTAEPYCFMIWPGHRFIFDYGHLTTNTQRNK